MQIPWRIRARWVDLFAPVPSLLLLAPICLALAWDWFNTVQTGFWLDECGSYWHSSHLPTLAQPFFNLRDLAFLYDGLLSLFLWGESPLLEVVARMPSLLGVFGCAAFLYSLSERVNGRGTGWIAALVYALLPTTLDFATQARPYALGQFFFAAALWALERWLTEKKTWALLVHLAALVLLIYMHPFFAPAWPLCWLLVMVAAPDRRKLYTVTLAAAAILLLPLVYMAKNLEVTVATIAYSTRPTLRMLGKSLIQERVGLALIAGIAASFLLRSRIRSFRPALAAWAAIVLAWPLPLFVLDHYTGSSFFMTRYLALSAVGFALFAAGLLYLWRPWIRQAIMLLIVVAHFAPGNHARSPRMGDIRALASWMQNPGGGASAPWIANSLFVEGRVRQGASIDNTLATWDFAHVTTYPVVNPVFPMPHHMAESGRAALEAHLDGPWRSENRIVAGPISGVPPPWLVEVMKQRGYHYELNGVILDFRR